MGKIWDSYDGDDKNGLIYRRKIYHMEATKQIRTKTLTFFYDKQM